MGSESYTRSQLQKMLTRFGREMAARGHGGMDIYIYGGAAMTLSDTFRMTAGDVDVHIEKDDLNVVFRDYRDMMVHALEYDRSDIDNHPLYRDVMASAEKVANDLRVLGINDDRWIDPGMLDLSRMTMRRDDFFDRIELPDSGGCAFYVMKMEPQLALKLLRMDPSQKDINDIDHLAEKAGIDHADGLVALWQRHANLLVPLESKHTDEQKVRGMWEQLQSYRAQKSGP